MFHVKHYLGGYLGIGLVARRSGKVCFSAAGSLFPISVLGIYR